MFITFEGIEGSGKGTLLGAVEGWLRARGIPYLLTREPGGSELGRHLRALLLDVNQQVAPKAELFLYLADRAQHVRHLVAPALLRGEVVLSDRFADSTIVYQGYGRGLDVEELVRLNEMAVDGLWPDCTLLLDVDPAVGLARARHRNQELGLEIAEGRFEAESLAFHERVRNGYLAWAQRNAERYRVLDASEPPHKVATAAERILETLFAGQGACTEVENAKGANQIHAF